jgi:hypothetical protein
MNQLWALLRASDTPHICHSLIITTQNQAAQVLFKVKRQTQPRSSNMLSEAGFKLSVIIGAGN